MNTINLNENKVEDLKKDYKIIPKELRVSRAREKQELRKMSEEYVDR